MTSGSPLLPLPSAPSPPCFHEGESGSCTTKSKALIRIAIAAQQWWWWWKFWIQRNSGVISRSRTEMSKSNTSLASGSAHSTSKLAGEVDKGKVVIDTVTTKREFHKLLLNHGVLDLFATILREIYEMDESEWPKNAEEYLLSRFLYEISIVKQMSLMNKNFQKRFLELEVNGKENLAKANVYYKNERKKVLQNEEAGPSASHENEIDEAPSTVPSSYSRSRRSTPKNLEELSHQVSHRASQLSKRISRVRNDY